MPPTPITTAGTRSITAAADRQPGTLVTPPYRVFNSKGVKVGVFGCTTNRGPQIVGPDVVKGVSFTDCKGNIKTGTPTQPLNKPIKFADGTTTTTVEAEIPKYVNILRNVEKVDVVVMLSEAGLAVELSRNNYSHMWDEANGIMPAVIEGTGHALIADAFRVIGKADIGAIRGFRYINNIPAGSELTYGDLYHYLSIGPQVARAKVAAAVISNSSENSADSCMNPNVTQWAGGWMFNYSGMTIDLNPYTSRVLLPPGSTDSTLIDKGRIFNMRVGRTSVFDPNPASRSRNRATSSLARRTTTAPSRRA